LPASEANAPFGIRIVSDGVCSNESGIEKSRTFIGRLSAEKGEPPEDTMTLPVLPPHLRQHDGLGRIVLQDDLLARL
jgi:hypothetical protein